MRKPPSPAGEGEKAVAVRMPTEARRHGCGRYLLIRFSPKMRKPPSPAGEGEKAVGVRTATEVRREILRYAPG